MEILTQKHVGFEENAIIRPKERISLFYLTIPVFVPHTAHEEAIILVYAEALKAGTGTLNRDAFLDAQSKFGSHIHVNGDTKSIHIVLSALDIYLAPTMRLFELMLTKPTFAQKEITRIKELLTNSLILSKEDSRTRAYEGFVNTLAQENDYRYMFSIDELITQIKNVTAIDLKKFHKEIYKFEWNLISGGSTASSRKIAASIKKIQHTHEHKVKIVSLPVPFTNRTKRTVILYDIPHKQNIDFSIGNTLPFTRNSSEYPAFIFGMNVLALYGGFSGRLMSTVREKEGLTYSIYGKVEKASKSEQGFWRIATFFSAKDAVKGIQATLREIELIREKGITESELKRFKTIMNTRATLINDSLQKKVNEIQGLRDIDITNTEYEAYKKVLQEISCTEVNEVLKKYLDTTNLVISGAGPLQNVKKEIEGFLK